MRILVVDDEEEVRLLLRLQLQRLGHEVVAEAVDGREALDSCRADPPDVVILDLLMPKLNGFRVIPKLRSELPDVAIVAYTAVAGDVVRDELRRLRIPLVLKSVNVAPLERALSEVAARTMGS